MDETVIVNIGAVGIGKRLILKKRLSHTLLYWFAIAVLFLPHLFHHRFLNKYYL